VYEQALVLAVLAAAMVLFVWGRLRYDMVALLALFALALAGVVPASEVFSGFSHPAVVTVAAVLVVSRGLINAGVVDVLAARVSVAGDSTTLQVAVLSLFVMVASAFMNNVAALALLMPVAIRLAHKNGTPASLLLMPIAFASLLGGMTTLIGTPPNIIIGSFRAKASGAPFGMFDFAPVGVFAAIAGGAYLAVAGWRLIRVHAGRRDATQVFEVGEYVSELQVPKESKAVGKNIREVATEAEADVLLLGIVRGGMRMMSPSAYEPLREGDVLLVQADAEALKSLVEQEGLKLAEDKKIEAEALATDEVALVEAVVRPGSAMEGRNARELSLRARHGINLLAIARAGERLSDRLAGIRLRSGDVLLMQGRQESLDDAFQVLGCLPLAERGLRIGGPRRLALAAAIFGSAIALATYGVLPVDIALGSAAVAMIAVGLIPLSDAYQSIDVSVIVLLAAMIPVGRAFETTGGADQIAALVLSVGRDGSPVVALAVLLIGTMLITEVVNNAAAAVLIAPIAVTVARELGVSADPFLMAAAVGGSAAFLTPIGHQSNTLVMGPGGYRFGDYWPVGLPLSVVVFAVALPMILWVWPLNG
jgi:di/tricarboxylate transporter